MRLFVVRAPTHASKIMVHLYRADHPGEAIRRHDRTYSIRLSNLLQQHRSWEVEAITAIDTETNIHIIPPLEPLTHQASVAGTLCEYLESLGTAKDP